MLKRLAVLSLISALSLQVSAFADTVTLKRGKEVKGIVVEDYQSRIVMSTVDGEQTIMKDDIGEIYYDTEEDNLIKLAERARASRNFVKAYGLYEKALKINPKSKAAQDGLVFCQSYIVRRQEAEKANDVQKRADFERYGGMAGGMQGEAPKEEDLKTRLNDALGMTLVIKDGIPAVEFVRQKSQASEAGIKVGDYIVAVWSRLTGYMSLKEIVDILSRIPLK